MGHGPGVAEIQHSFLSFYNLNINEIERGDNWECTTKSNIPLPFLCNI